MEDRTFHPGATARWPRLRLRPMVGCLAFALLFALPAWSGNLVQVRVGNHPTYTRVVFEFDAPSGYRIERRAEGEPENTILVTLDAASRARNIVSKSRAVASIAVDAGSGRAVAHIMTRHAGLPIREMILTDPPRVVLDLMIPGTEPAPHAEVAEAKPQTAASEPTAAPPDEIAVAEPEPQPEPVAVPPSEVAARSESEVIDPGPETEVAQEPSLQELPDLAVSETPAPDDAIAEVEEMVVEAEATVDGVEDSVAETTAEAADAVAESATDSAAPLAVIDLADLTARANAARADTARADEIAPAARPGIPEASPAHESAKAVREVQAETDAPASPVDWKLAGVIAAGVLALLALVTLVMRSRRSKPAEMDVTELAGEAEASDPTSHDGRIREGGLATDASFQESSAADEDFEFGASDAHDDENKPIESAGIATDAAPGLFDESHQKEDAMSMDNQDLPTSHVDSEAATQLGIGAAAVAADMDSSVANLVQEFERRLAHLEARLDESNEARERLERQVETQAEELRVQRAAIARTQRAVRSLNRPDEDQATEPALRDPSTPTTS